MHAFKVPTIERMHCAINQCHCTLPSHILYKHVVHINGNAYTVVNFWYSNLYVLLSPTVCTFVALTLHHQHSYLGREKAAAGIEKALSGIALTFSTQFRLFLLQSRASHCQSTNIVCEIIPLLKGVGCAPQVFV
jgi:hypothetical protein